MPKKGGKSEDELADFDSVPNPAEADMKKRIEQAEDAGIDKASAERKEREAKNIADKSSDEEICEDCSSSKGKIFVVTAVMVVFGAALLLTLVWVGINIGTSNLFNPEVEETEQISEIIDVDYDSLTLSYSLGEKDASKNKAGYLLQEYGANDNYVVIKSMSQLERLQKLYNAHSSNEINLAGSMNIDSSFFTSGSVIAITDEAKYSNIRAVSGVYRDESYNLSVTLKKMSFMTGVAIENLHGDLVLIKVENIQPKQVQVNIVDDSKEAE